MTMVTPTAISASTRTSHRYSRRVEVGVDVHDVHDVVHALCHFGDQYLTRVFNEEEIAHVRAHPFTDAVFLTGRYAAREAVVKLLRLDNAVPLRALVDLSGVASVRVELRGEALDAARHKGITEILLSIDHGRRFATAIAVADVDNLNQGGPP
jgi:holo-[acyl-carrier protein] synthase